MMGANSKRKFGLICLILLLAFSVIGFSSCGLGGGGNGGKTDSGDSSSEDDTPAPSVYGLVADFENYDEVRKFVFEWQFGAASVNTDAKYITSGKGSLKVTNTKSTAKFTIPLKDESVGKDYTDASKLSKIELDVYNDSAEIYTLAISLVFKDGLVSSDVQNIVVQPKSWNNFVWQVDVKKISVSANLNEATGVAINFETNSGKDKTVYLDRLQFYYSSSNQEVYDVVVDDGEFCSFEKDYQEYGVYSGVYGTSKDNWPITSINTDANYVKEGSKSLKVTMPASVKGRYPYVAFSPKVLETANLAQYGNNAALSFWVYNAQDRNFYLILDFFRKGYDVQRGFHYPAVKPGWNKIVLPFAEINKVDGGVDLLTASLEQFRLVYESFEETETLKEKVLYFDDFRIITGDAMWEDIVKPSTNELYELEDTVVRTSVSARLEENFSSYGNRGTISITDEQATTVGGYSVKLGDLSGLTQSQKSWIVLNLEKVSNLINYIQGNTEYAKNDVLTFKFRTDAGKAFLCKSDAKLEDGTSGYKLFGVDVGEIVADSTGWTTVTCPVEDMLNNQIQMLVSGCDAVYFDDFKLLPSYKITWKNGDEVLGTTKAIDGQTPKYLGETPRMPVSNGVGKVFTGWTPEVVPATKNATYSAVYADSPKPTDENVYNFEVYPLGADVSAEFGGVEAIISDVTEFGTGKSVRYTVEKRTEWGILKFSEILTNLPYAKNYLKTATKMQLTMHVEGSGSVLLCADYDTDRNYRMFGQSYVKVSVSKVGWTTVLVNVAEITDNEISYFASGACYLYIDSVKLVKSETFTYYNDDGSYLATVEAVPGEEVYNGNAPVSAVNQDATFVGFVKTGEYSYTATYLVAKNVVNGLVLNYVSQKPYDAGKIAEWAPETINSNTYDTDFSRPEGVLLEWTSQGENVDYTLLISENDGMNNAWEFTTGDNFYTVYNLKVGTRYYWQVITDTWTSEIAEFATLGYAPRLITAGGATNVRDLGGYSTGTTTRIKQGLIYRSATLDKLTEAGKAVLKDQLGIKTEIDLRSTALDGITLPEDGVGNGALGAGVNYFKCNLTWQLAKDDNASEVQKLFDILADESNYPIIFHCSQGADRTGWVAYVLERLLGVSENDCYKDYCITDFSKQNLGSRRNAGAVYEYSQIMNAYSGTRAEQCATYLKTNKGVAEDKINAVKSILNGTVENPELWIAYPETAYFDYIIEVYKDGSLVELSSLKDAPVTHVMAYTWQDITAFAESNIPEGYYILSGKSVMKGRITENGVKFVVRYAKAPVGGVLYDFDEMENGEKLSGDDNRGGEINLYADSVYKDVTVTDEFKFGDGGKSAKAEFSSTDWGTIRLNNLSEYISAGKINMPSASYLQISVAVKGDGYISLNSGSYTLFGAIIEGKGKVNIDESSGWVTFYIPLDKIEHNRFLYAASGNGTVYIDNVKIVESIPSYYGEDIENGDSFVWSKPTSVEQGWIILD